MKCAWVAAALIASSACSRCGERRPADAGTGTPGIGAVTDGGPVTHSIDLRTVLLLAFPENRGADIQVGRATLIRRAHGLADWKGAVSQAFGRMSFALQDAGTDALLVGANAGLNVSLQSVQGDAAELRFWLELDDEVVMKLYGAPVSLSTQEMALYFPRDKQAVVDDERFIVALDYVADERRAAFLTKQALQLLERSGMFVFEGARPWADDAGVPDEFVAVMRNVDDGAKYTVKRHGALVHVEYELATFERPAQ